MNRLSLITTIAFSAFLICTSCNKEGEEPFIGIENISFENYPRVDCSTSAYPLNMMVACKLLGVRYGWYDRLGLGEWHVDPNYDDLPEKYQYGFWGHRVKSSQTHGAFMNLINNEADIILTHRTISPDEKNHADALGVTLIETPIAMDAFVFIVNKSNKVKSLTVSQIQQIYQGKITNWSQVGGNNEDIQVFTRPRNSGSEEVFRTLVMNGMEPAEFPEAPISAMSGVFTEVIHAEKAICYTFNTYKELQARKHDNEVPKIAINDVFPENKTIQNGTYPFISKVHVAIRSDLDHNSMAYKLYEWLQSENAKSTITECGFLPK